MDVSKNPTAPKKRGPKPHEPTPEKLASAKALAAFGVPQEQIARYLGVTAKTLRLRYAEALDDAATQFQADVGKFLGMAATGLALDLGKGATYADCLRAAMFVGKTRMGLHETARHELTGANGGPIQSQAVDLSKLSPAALAELDAALGPDTDD